MTTESVHVRLAEWYTIVRPKLMREFAMTQEQVEGLHAAWVALVKDWARGR